MKPKLHITACLLALPTFATGVSWGQTTVPEKKPLTSVEEAEHIRLDSVDRTYTLHYAASQAEQNEILTDLRNMINPMAKIFLVPSSNAISVHAPEDEQARIVKLLAAIDKPKPRYRLTYTLTELDGTKKLGVQHFSMSVLNGQRSQMKQGSRIPLYSGTQYTYYEVGTNFDATFEEIQGGGVLRSKVELTSIVAETGANSQAPVIRQTLLEATTSLTTGKPLVLGSLDVPSSTRHFDVEVQMDPVN